MVKTLSRTIADDTNELPGDAPKPTTRKPGFRTQKEAKDAGLFELGEFARHGFEYETWKCDGRWFFKKCDEVKPPTAADLKASGGKKGPKADAAAREQAKHEQRGAERAKAEGRLREDMEQKTGMFAGTSLTALAQAITDGTPGKAVDASKAPEASSTRAREEGRLRDVSLAGGEIKPLSPAASQLGRMGFTDVAEWPSEGIPAKKPRRAPRKTVGEPKAPEASPAATEAENAPEVLQGADTGIPEEMPGAPSDPLAIPTFLQRPKPTAAETEAVRKKLAKVIGPERVIKNPPDAKVAKANAKKRAAGSKTALIGSMLLDPKGSTAAEAMKAVGWTKISMPDQARKNGLTLTTKKDGSVTRYFGSK